MGTNNEVSITTDQYEAMVFEAGRLLNVLAGWIWVHNVEKSDEICDKIKENYFLSQNPELLSRIQNGYYSLSEDDIHFLVELSLAYL
ncbi:MAG: hypothetical protein HFJ34_01745 [Clostridia bacterium]|nr:hypothetical protein [Clostridia bacterium]